MTTAATRLVTGAFRQVYAPMPSETPAHGTQYRGRSGSGTPRTSRHHRGGLVAGGATARVAVGRARVPSFESFATRGRPMPRSRRFPPEPWSVRLRGWQEERASRLNVLAHDERGLLAPEKSAGACKHFDASRPRCQTPGADPHPTSSQALARVRAPYSRLLLPRTQPQTNFWAVSGPRAAARAIGAGRHHGPRRPQKRPAPWGRHYSLLNQSLRRSLDMRLTPSTAGRNPTSFALTFGRIKLIIARPCCCIRHSTCGLVAELAAARSGGRKATCG